MRLPHLLLCSIVALTLSFSQAQANIFVVGNDDDGFSIAYPDSWGRGNNQQPDDKLTIFAPENGDQATCKVKVREDRRFVSFAPQYSQDLQYKQYSRAFWEDYLYEYDDAQLARVVDGLQLAQMPASRADASYTTADTDRFQKRAVMMGGLYQGRAYIVECSALANAFDQWHGAFVNIMDSMTPHSTGNGQINSYYRDFQNDPLLIINRQGGPNYSLYY